jgi:hypothetical protein
MWLIVPFISFALGKMPGTGFNSSMLRPCISFAELPHPVTIEAEQIKASPRQKIQPLIRSMPNTSCFFNALPREKRTDKASCRLQASLLNSTLSALASSTSATLSEAAPALAGAARTVAR